MVDRKKFVGRVLFSSINRFVGGSGGDDGTYEGISRSTPSYMSTESKKMWYVL
jgi:hypothetical protein